MMPSHAMPPYAVNADDTPYAMFIFRAAADAISPPLLLPPHYYFELRCFSPLHQIRRHDDISRTLRCDISYWLNIAPCYAFSTVSPLYFFFFFRLRLYFFAMMRFVFIVDAC